MRTLDQLAFDNTCACLPDSFHTKPNPTPFPGAPYLAGVNAAAAELIDLDLEEAARPSLSVSSGLIRIGFPASIQKFDAKILRHQHSVAYLL